MRAQLDELRYCAEIVLPAWPTQRHVAMISHMGPATRWPKHLAACDSAATRVRLLARSLGGKRAEVWCSGSDRLKHSEPWDGESWTTRDSEGGLSRTTQTCRSSVTGSRSPAITDSLYSE